ncbi:ciliogenesis and planar polarity effector 1 isoform X1 [Cyprinodon tularosa]|uniref:ciliogenesis and planar polarity effector 1 isoform X1 n=1 Tax=Cyprinodon tularosa TaxID=77115 RepID=UPI0018E23A34|nr:ciliogenesis and planar polarity effector 1 isoform X1 [Cyprinodon tularosa]
MELKLEVVVSSSIKRKKPWPRFCWLGQEKESVFLLDDKRISEINMVSGRTKKKIPKLHPLLSSVVKMTPSHNGMWLCGVLVSGELFLWNRDKDLLKTATAVPEVIQMINSAQGNFLKLCLQVSCDGTRVLLTTITGQVFLWECTERKDFPGLRDGPVKGQWTNLLPLKETILPSSKDKEASQQTIFLKTEVMMDICLSAFIFISGKQLVVTILKIQWSQGSVRMGSVGYTIQWASKTYPMSHLYPPCQPVKSRGALVPAFSPDGRLLAIVLNQRKPKDTQVLFVSMQNFVSISSDLGGCGSKKMDIPSKYVRSYWVSSISWSAGGLFLACVLKRGSLLMLARLGGLLTLTSSGCNVDFGPAHFLPLHPLVTYRPPLSGENGEASLSSSSLSLRDLMRQRFSVTWHPRLLYLIVSDGYMATVMKVQGRLSAALFLNALLKEAGKDLEKASSKLEKSQVHVKAWLESMSCFNSDSSLEELSPSVTCRLKVSDSTILAATDQTRLPLFLQDQQTLGGTKELLESMQTFFEEDSDLEGLPVGSRVQEGGRLEFASMFDTLHAMDTYSESVVDTNSKKRQTEKKNPLYSEMGKIQRKLLTAWAFAMSLGDEVEHRVHLLKRTLYCVVWFAALLHLAPIRARDTPVSTRLLHLIKALLSFLSWDSLSSDGQHCLGLMVGFTERIVSLLFTPQPEGHLTENYLLSSQSLSRIIQIMHLVSDSLDCTYSLEQKTYWSPEEFSSSQPYLWSSDVYHVPLLQAVNKDTPAFKHQPIPVPRQPSSRLLGVWQLIYDVTQRYAEELKKLKGCDGMEEEEQKLSAITSQIQTALQATGENLEEGRLLLDYQGEDLFLCGLYAQSTQMLRLQICEEANKGGKRSVFQETRLCLALLYSLLSQYHLREGQELGDHMAQLLLLRAGNQTESLTCNSDHLPYPWLPMDLPSDAALAVVQALGRFMASYFTNQPLFILPAHNVSILPPLHLPHASNIGRLVPLSQEEVAKAVRQQHLSEVWTVDYAQDLLLLGGLIPEAVWLASHLGDWKTAVTLSLAYTSYCSRHFDFTQIRRRDFLLPSELQPESIFQAELKSLLGSKTDSEKTFKNGNECFTDPSEGEDWELLQASVHEILKASAMAGVNVMSFPLSTLLDKAKDMCSFLPTLVPAEVYLPAPPLYCPQPSLNTQDQSCGPEEFAEVVCRHKVSGVLQRLLLLLRSAHCCRPAAQWYISRLRRARHILHKIKKKYSYPSAAEEENTFPEGLLKLISRSGYFRRDPNKDDHLDPDTIQTIICFRELCALCWMLHVRDQLSLLCRKYQAARQEAIPEDSQVNSANVNALLWACRLLPFIHFLGGEEVLQDILLSLLSELPPVPLVAETLVRVFPQEEDSVRVSLREKYNLLLQRLGQCNLEEGGEDGNKLKMIFVQDRKRHRRKHFGRLQRHLAMPVLHLWTKADEEEERGGRNDMATLGQLSLATTVSTSSLTDGGFQPVCSDADTAANTPEAISPERHKSRKKKSNKDDKKIEPDLESDLKGNPNITARDKEQLSLPVVGSWEFELEDDEYLNFLELFLSYVLEKDTTDAMDCGDELPLLKGFSYQLREKELHSLTFDVVSTVHRRQRGGHLLETKHSGKPSSVFRAGCCYKHKQNPITEAQTSSVWSEDPISRDSIPVSLHLGQRTEKHRGLFGLRQQSDISSARVKKANLSSTVEHPAESLKPGFLSSVETVTDLQQGLDPELEARFPELGRLLEWMVRWADRRILLGHHNKKKNDSSGKPDEGVVIRVKATAPAILTSLGLLEHRYTTSPQTEQYTSYCHVPEMQWTVLPMLHSDVERKTERESSIDTGYPGSANTPITGPDLKVQQEETSPSVMDEREELTSPPPVDQVQLRPPGSPQPSFTDLDFMPEKDRSWDSKSVAVIPSDSSEATSKDVCTPETSLKLEDLDYAEKRLSSSQSHYPPVKPEPPALPDLHREPPPHAESPDSGPAPLPNPSTDQPSLQPQISTAGAPPPDCTTPAPPLITPPMRQRLGEDLLRLVQHINYMSLNEVLGATFSSLQLAQRSSSSVIPGMNSSQPNVPSSSVTQVIREENIFPVQNATSAVPRTHACLPKSESSDPQVNQMESCHFAAQPVMQKTGDNLNHCVMQPLSVQAASPEIQESEKRRLIPSSHGLLATTHGSDTNPHLPPKGSAQTGSKGSGQTGSAVQMLGLKLLKLHHSATSQQAVPRFAAQHTQTPESHQPKVTLYHQSTWKNTDGQHLTFNPSHDPPHRNSPSPIWPLGASVGQTFPLLPPAFQTPISTSLHGLRLLQLQDVPRSSIRFPKLTTAVAPRPVVISAGMTEAPLIRLLHIDPGPKVMEPQGIHSNSMSHLMEELTSAETLQQDTKVAPLQLPRQAESYEGIRKLTSSLSLSSSKRQKRREDKTKGRKTEVSFCLNESIIPAKEAAHVPESKEAAITEEIKPAQDMTVAGSSSDLLTDNRLLEKVFSTSAELHAFASTSKHPPECHDAFTNTEPALTPTVENRSVSVQASVKTSSPKMQSLENFPEDPVRGTVENQHEPEMLKDPAGRQFLSVFDLEDVRQHEAVLPSSSLQPRDVSSPTSAQLHVLATSVFSSAALNGSQPSTSVPNDLLKPRSTTEVPEAPPSFSHSGSSRPAERIPLNGGASVDSGESKTCRAIKDQTRVSDRAPSSPPAVCFSSRLSELDSQLAALQNIADRLEMDFSHSRMLVNKIEKLSSESESDAKGFKRSVRLSAPIKAWTSRTDPDLLPALKECDEIREEQEEESMFHKVSCSPATKSSPYDSTKSFSPSRGPSSAHIAPGKKEHYSESYDVSHEWTEMNLGQTELSDTMEILDELVKEGYLSPSDWEPTQTAGPSRRQDQQQHGWTSQNSTRTEEEKKDLRIWMRQKQRDRLAAYQKHRQSLREREHKPFSASSAGLSASRKQSSSGRNKDEKEKSMLLKQSYQRTQEACSLAKDILSSSVTASTSTQGFGPPVLSSTWLISPPAPSPFNASRPLTIAANDKRSLKSQSGVSPPPPHYSAEGRPSEDRSRRLGLHRPVTFLPGDRLSQITRRGMLSNTKNQSKFHESNQSQGQRVGFQTRTGSNDTVSCGAALRRGNQRELRQVKEPKTGEDSSLVLDRILDGQDGAVPGGVSEFDWLDDLSDSAGSSLSRIDWAAIERIVATEED